MFSNSAVYQLSALSFIMVATIYPLINTAYLMGSGDSFLLPKHLQDSIKVPIPFRPSASLRVWDAVVIPPPSLSLETERPPMQKGR